MTETNKKNRRKSLVVSISILALAVVAGGAIALLRVSPAPQPPTPQSLPLAKPPPVKSQSPLAKSKQPHNHKAQGSKKPFAVLIWIETTPPGASIVRLSDNFILGWTPEIVGFGQSDEPVPVRLELEGYIPVTRNVPAERDGTLTVVLKPDKKKKAAKTKKSNGLKKNNPST